MPASADTLYRNIVARLAYVIDTKNLEKFNQLTNEQISKIGKMGKLFQAAGREKRAEEIQKLRIEKERLTIATRKNALETAKERTLTQKTNTELKKAQIVSRKLADEIKRQNQAKKQANASSFSRKIEAQREAMRRFSEQTIAATAALGSFLAQKVGGWSVNLAVEEEKTKNLLENATDIEQFDQIEKKIQTIREQSKGLFHSSEIRKSAAEYFAVDQNMRRLNKTLNTASLMAPVLGESFEDVAEAIKDFYATGNSNALEEWGILNQEEIQKLRLEGHDLTDEKRFGREQREAFLDRHSQITSKHVELAKKSFHSISSTQKRFVNMLHEFGQALGKRVNPFLRKMLNIVTRLKMWAVANGFDQVLLKMAAWGVVGGGVLLLIVAMSKALSILGLTTLFVKTVFVAYKTVMIGFQVAAFLATTAVALLNLAISALTWPIVLAIAAVVAFAVAMYFLWKAFDGSVYQKKLMDFFRAVWRRMLEFASQVKEWITDLAEEIARKSQELWERLKELWKSSEIRRSLNDFFKVIEDFWRDLEKMFQENIRFPDLGIDSVLARFKEFDETIQEVWNTLRKLFSNNESKGLFSFESLLPSPSFVPFSGVQRTGEAEESKSAGTSSTSDERANVQVGVRMPVTINGMSSSELIETLQSQFSKILHRHVYNLFDGFNNNQYGGVQ